MVGWVFLSFYLGKVMAVTALTAAVVLFLRERSGDKNKG